jgi:hypothetical protein
MCGEINKEKDVKNRRKSEMGMKRRRRKERKQSLYWVSASCCVLTMNKYNNPLFVTSNNE